MLQAVHPNLAIAWKCHMCATQMPQPCAYVHEAPSCPNTVIQCQFSVPFNVSRFQGTMALSELIHRLDPQVERSNVNKSRDHEKLLLTGCLQSPLFSLKSGSATCIYNG
jgi:hypothetical protein